jgi:hypothetical protein
LNCHDLFDDSDSFLGLDEDEDENVDSNGDDENESVYSLEVTHFQEIIQQFEEEEEQEENIVGVSVVSDENELEAEKEEEEEEEEEYSEHQFPHSTLLYPNNNTDDNHNTCFYFNDNVQNNNNFPSYPLQYFPPIYYEILAPPVNNEDLEQ